MKLPPSFWKHGFTQQRESHPWAHPRAAPSPAVGGHVSAVNRVGSDAFSLPSLWVGLAGQPSGHTLNPFHVPPAQVAGLGPQPIFQSWVMLVLGDTTLHFHLEKRCLLLLVRLEPRPRKQWAPLFYLIALFECFDG